VTDFKRRTHPAGCDKIDAAGCYRSKMKSISLRLALSLVPSTRWGAALSLVEGEMKAGMFALRIGAALAASLMLGSLAVAGDHWKFKVVNQSKTAALEFRTQENDEWSSNWISDRIEPGDTFNMDFGTSKGDCTVRTQIHFADGSKFDAPVDYCKVNHLYIHDDTISWD
jgi:hypothetical protein